jgi:hypothetical protein
MAASAEYRRGYEAGRKRTQSQVDLELSVQILGSLLESKKEWKLEGKNVTGTDQWCRLAVVTLKHLKSEVGK